MRTLASLLGVTALLVGARFTRVAASGQQVKSTVAQAPFAPSAAAAPFVSLGYRELAADLFSLRLTGYFAGDGDEAPVTASLVEAVVALDPKYARTYEFGARAITLAELGIGNDVYLRAINVLKTGSENFPKVWKFPLLASQIYLQDLQTDDPKLRREWDEKGLLLAEAALRKPGAPADTAENIAAMRTKLGQKERAIVELREMLLVTEDKKAREGLLRRLAELADSNSTEIAAELLTQRKQFETAWHSGRDALPATMFVLLGERETPPIDFKQLAVGKASVDFSAVRNEQSVVDEK